MRKNKIEVYDLATIAHPNETSEENLNNQDNISVNNTNEQTFEMLLENSTLIESLVTFTIYNR